MSKFNQIMYKTNHSEKEKKKPGPKGLFSESMVEEVYLLARFGLTNHEIAEFYKISDSTFENYQRKYPEFNSSLLRGRMVDSLKVVASLHKQALGYDVDETEDRQILTRLGKIITLHTDRTKHIQPNVTAAIYLLKTRHGDKWMDIIKTQSTHSLNINFSQTDVEGFTVDELKYLERIGMKRLAEASTEDVHTN